MKCAHIETKKLSTGSVVCTRCRDKISSCEPTNPAIKDFVRDANRTILNNSPCYRKKSSTWKEEERCFERKKRALTLIKRGLTVNQICNNLGVATSTFSRWRSTDVEFGTKVDLLRGY